MECVNFFLGLVSLWAVICPKWMVVDFYKCRIVSVCSDTSATTAPKGRWHFTGSGNMFSLMEKKKLVGMANGLWQDYQSAHPSASLDEFYRDNSLQLRQQAHDLHVSRQNSVYVTPENHLLLQAVAEYEVLIPDQVVACLEEAEEFVFAGESESNPNADYYNWLLRGRSHIPEGPDWPEKTLQIRSE